MSVYLCISLNKHSETHIYYAYPDVGIVDFYFYLDVLCKEQMLLQVQDIGGWITFPETIHELYAHLAELIGKGMEMFCNFNINIFNRVE